MRLPATSTQHSDPSVPCIAFSHPLRTGLCHGWLATWSSKFISVYDIYCHVKSVQEHIVHVDVNTQQSLGFSLACDPVDSCHSPSQHLWLSSCGLLPSFQPCSSGPSSEKPSLVSSSKAVGKLSNCLPLVSCHQNP